MNKDEHHNSRERDAFPPIIESIEFAINEIETYNARASGFSGALGRIIGSIVEESSPEEVENDSDELIESVHSLNLDDIVSADNVHNKLDEDLMKFNAEPILRDVGLAIYDRDRVIHATDSASNKGTPPTKGLYVEDFNLFEEFIDENKSEIEKSDLLLNNIAKLYNTMILEINSTKGDYREGLAEDLGKLTEIIKDLKFKENVPNIELGEAYANWSKKPEFNDFLESRELGLRGGKDFDAHHWHKDSPKEKLDMRWKNLLKHFASVSERFGDKNDLTILMKMEIQEALDEFGKWVKNPPKNMPAEYLQNTEKVYQSVLEEYKKLHL